MHYTYQLIRLLRDVFLTKADRFADLVYISMILIRNLICDFKVEINKNSNKCNICNF